MAQGATQVNYVVIHEQKNMEKGSFLRIVVVFFTYRRGPCVPRLGYHFHEILEKRVYFSAVSYWHLLYEFQRYQILQ